MGPSGQKGNFKGNLFSFSKWSDVLQTAAGAVLAPTRFSSVKISSRDLVPNNNLNKEVRGWGWGSKSDFQ